MIGEELKYLTVGPRVTTTAPEAGSTERLLIIRGRL